MAVLGLQWGDEGKGKIVDFLASEFDHAVRFNGGDNAGHAVKVAGKRVGLRLVPSAIFHPRVTPVLAAGVALNPDTLLDEVEALEDEGFLARGVLVSERAHLVLPWHLARDASRDQRTTRRGIGPAYADKVGRTDALRAGDLLDVGGLPERLAEVAARKMREMRGSGRRASFEAGAILPVLKAFARKFRRSITDTTRFLNDVLDRGERVLLEGAQGALLDVDHGTYPHVTASSTVAGGACAGAGLAPRRIDRVVGVVKGYMTRVGRGPFPTEAEPAQAQQLRQRGLEFGVATGVLRRCGWLDLVALEHAVMLDGPAELALTKLDVLSGFGCLPVCVAYRAGRKKVRSFPSSARALEAAEPVYEILPGFGDLLPEDWRDVAQTGRLPDSVRRFVDRIESAAGVPVRTLSFGAAREDTMPLHRG